MSAALRAPRVQADSFERKYESSADPWGYCTSEYEQVKYADTLAAIGPGRFGRALEVGCSIGVFSALLAPRCGQLLAIDFSAGALKLAHERLAAVSNAELQRASFPEQAPAGTWDLIVCSEVLYYLDERSLHEAIGWLCEQLERGACVIAVSWRGRGCDEPWSGDEVHDLLAGELARWHRRDGRRDGYRLDRFAGDGS